MTGFLATIVGVGFRFHQLDASTGASDPIDFTVRYDALVFRTTASTAPCPAFATTADAPLVGQDGGIPTVDLPDGSTEIFSNLGLDTISDNPK